MDVQTRMHQELRDGPGPCACSQRSEDISLGQCHGGHIPRWREEREVCRLLIGSRHGNRGRVQLSLAGSAFPRHLRAEGGLWTEL